MDESGRSGLFTVISSFNPEQCQKMKRSGGVRQVSPVSHSQSVGTKVLLPPLRWKRTLHSDSINESNSSGISQFSFLPLLWNHECTSWPVTVRLDWIAQKNGCRGFLLFRARRYNCCVKKKETTMSVSRILFTLSWDSLPLLQA